MEQPSFIEQEAIRIVRSEKQQWETATAFITEKVAFNMRNLIRQMRKNYYGIFDEETDPVTGRKKTWVPLTESFCEDAVKNIDLDTKDMNFRSKKPSGYALTNLIRNSVKNTLDKMSFGEILDRMERSLAIDGTVVWKTFEEKDEENKGKKKVVVKQVDLLNFYIDPTAECIQDEDTAVIERGIFPIDQIKSNKNYINTDKIKGMTNINRTDGELGQFSGNVSGTGETKMVELFERWGKIPKYLLTGDKEKDTQQVDGRIVVSANGSQYILHLIEGTDGNKPYEEAWYSRVPGRWYGKGVAEKVWVLQVWINTIVNIRITRSFVTQLGIFKIKQGSNITPQMLSRLTANGAIPVNRMDDIEQMVVQDASPASYKDEDIVRGWAERNTSLYEVATGESLPSSTPATNAAIQSKASGSTFVFIKEGIGLFLQRWMTNHALPIIQKNITVGDVIRLTSEPDELREIHENIVNCAIAEQLEEANKNGLYVDPQEVMMERDKGLEILSRSGKDYFANLKDNIDLTEYDIEFYVTNEEVDKGVLVSNLLTELKIAPEYRDQILNAANDVMGLPPFKKPQQMMQPPAQGMPVPTQDPMQMMSQVNTLQNV